MLVKSISSYARTQNNQMISAEWKNTVPQNGRTDSSRDQIRKAPDPMCSYRTRSLERKTRIFGEIPNLTKPQLAAFADPIEDPLVARVLCDWWGTGYVM